MSEVEELGKKARAAASKLATMTTSAKDEALLAMADALVSGAPLIVERNKADLESGREQGISGALMDRLTLTEARIGEMAEGLREVAAMRDPVGEIVDGWRMNNGLAVEKVRVPLGVVGIIYEARPNVTVDAAGLCMKSGNAVVLRGSSKAGTPSSCAAAPTRSIPTPSWSRSSLKRPGKQGCLETACNWSARPIAMPPGR